MGAYQTGSEEDHKLLFEFVERFTEIPGDVSYASTENTFSLVPKVLFDENHLEKVKMVLGMILFSFQKMEN